MYKYLYIKIHQFELPKLKYIDKFLKMSTHIQIRCTIFTLRVDQIYVMSQLIVLMHYQLINRFYKTINIQILL